MGAPKRPSPAVQPLPANGTNPLFYGVIHSGTTTLIYFAEITVAFINIRP